MSGLFRMERGQQLRVLCGSMSSMGPQGNSGGGGGSYVVAEDEDNPLVVAGGGGGTRQDHLCNLNARYLSTCCMSAQANIPRAVILDNGAVFRKDGSPGSL